MKQAKEEAMKMRIKGKSYNEINKKLGIPKSTLSGWFSDLVLSESAQDRLNMRVRQGTMNGLIKHNKNQTSRAWERANKIQEEAWAEIGTLSHRELLLVGAALYWGEGYKKLKVKNGKKRTSHVISMTNSDPAMIRLFIRFLKEVMDVPEDKIYICMRLYPHINESDSRRYWKKITGLNDDNFRKTTFLVSRSSKGKRPYNRLPHGTLQVIVNSTKKFHRLIGWIEGIKIDEDV